MNKKTPHTARYLAIHCLCRLNKTGQPVTTLFDALIDKCPPENRERRLAFHLLYGVLRHYQTLDHLLGGFLKKPVKKLHPVALQGLRVGCYQLLFLDKIPESAAVNETITALKRLRLPRHLTGLVNGVLRTLTRKRQNLPDPCVLESGNEPILNHPQWLTDRWRKRYGTDEMIRICRANNQPATCVLRLNPSVINREDYGRQLAEQGIGSRKGHLAPDALLLPDFTESITTLPGYGSGSFMIQDEGAQLVTCLLSPLQEKGRYLDGCGGLGGKTAHLAHLGREQQIHISCVEPQKHRYHLLLDNINRLRLNQAVTPHQHTLEDFAGNSPQPFDGVLLDVPCSGTGVIGRHPDIRWNRKENDLVTYPKRQLELLEHGARLVRPGGVLVYATCSLEPEENDEVINCFLDQHQHFRLNDCSPSLPETARHLVRHKCLHIRPANDIDGFFGARLIRKK